MMKVMILGMGNVGKALAKKLRADNHEVIGTTIDPEEVADLEKIADKVAVLYGNETDKVLATADGCDFIVVTVAPHVKNTRTIDERHEHYRDVLVESCASVRKTGIPAFFCSSFSVYGDGGEGSEPITELTPTSNHEEPSSLYYQLAEKEILANGNGVVLRFPDMYGAPGDLSFTEKVKMAIEFFGGKTLFDPTAPYYAIHFEDVINALHHAIDNGLNGILNVCDNDILPPTNKEIFDAICDKEGWAYLEYTSAIKAPNRKISAQKMYDTGYKIQQGDPHESLFAEASD